MSADDFHRVMAIMVAIGLVCAAIDAVYWAEPGDDEDEDDGDGHEDDV